MRKILVINGHPNPTSLCSALANAYANGVKKAGMPVSVLHLGEMDFNPVLKYGYQKRTELEPDLLKAWELIKAADHLVWVFPNWWGTYPALLKGFIDRLFLPGFAFSYPEKGFMVQKLLKGKTAHLMQTMDSPGIYYNLFLKRPGQNSLKRSVLGFVGVKTKKLSTFRIVKNADEAKIQQWLQQAECLGVKLA